MSVWVRGRDVGLCECVGERQRCTSMCVCVWVRGRDVGVCACLGDRLPWYSP